MLWFPEHNDVGINGEPDDSSSPAIPADAANGLDEVAKRQCLPLVIGFHKSTISREALWGYKVFTPPGISMNPSDLWARGVSGAGHGIGAG